MEVMPLRLPCNLISVCRRRSLLTLFIILIPWLYSYCGACEDFTCGEYVLPYPFGYNNSGCGDFALRLECDQDHLKPKPVLNISGNKYYILYRNGKFNCRGGIMTVIDKNLEDHCDPSSNNYTEFLSGYQFHFVDGYRSITLWGQCDPMFEDLPSQTATLQCNGDWHYNLTSGLRLPGACKAQVVVPINKEKEQFGLDPVNENEIEHGGFKIRWRVSTYCEDCQASGGLCAYDNISLQVFCQCFDGTSHPHKCPHDKSTAKISIVLGCSIGGVALVALVLFLTFYMKRVKRHPSRGHLGGDFGIYQRNDMEICRSGYMNLSIFSYQELQQATNFFDEKNKLGDGGFGSVYRGKLKDGRCAAVKRLYQDNYKRVEQFINEVQILSSLHHPNLVQLYGCTYPQSPVLLLVYEFVPNGTLADHLHGNRRTPKGLAWGTRLNIAIETAQALAFLHSLDPPIFHRDVKSTNILVDGNFSAKVADFGLSRLLPANVSQVTTTPQGTPGYLDPEYHECFQLTDKSDVYSFGVVLAEIISAKVAVDTTRNRREISLANMALDKIRSGALDGLVDPDLKIELNQEVKLMVYAVAELVFGCLATDSDVRPDMKEVAARLEEIKQVEERTASGQKNSFSKESTIDVI